MIDSVVDSVDNPTITVQKGANAVEGEIMAVTAKDKTKVIQENRLNNTDTGSPEVQVALITSRIGNLTKHFGTHVKDHASRRGLIKMVSQRRRLLDYLKKSSLERYNSLIAKLGLRK